MPTPLEVKDRLLSLFVAEETYFLFDVSPARKVIWKNAYGGCSKVLSFFPGLSQDLREAFASFRAWGFTTVGENGFSLGLEAFKDSCSCPGTSCVL